MNGGEKCIDPKRTEDAYRMLGQELWALLYAHCCDAERAYDALQEAFLRLEEQNGTPIADLRAWLLTVGRNWLRDVARRQRHSAESLMSLDHLPGPQAEPSTMAAEAELHRQVRDELKRLRVTDREVLVLRYALGWSSQRIAAVLGSTATAVDMRLSRARRRLAELLDDTRAGHDRHVQPFPT